MFDPTGVAKLTITSPNGTQREMEGHVARMKITTEDGIDVGANVEFVATQRINFEPAGDAPSKEVVKIDGGSLDVEHWGMTDPPVKLPPPDECRVCGQSVATCGCEEWSGGIPSSDDSTITPDRALPSETLTEREERLREPGGPALELIESGKGDTLNCASRMFIVRLDDVFTQDPLRALQDVVRLGDAHPRSPELYAVRFIVEERLTEKAFRCRVEYEIGRWEWYKRGGARRMDEDKYDREVRGVVPDDSPPVGRSWTWETWSPDAWLFVSMIPVAAVARLILGWIL